MYRNTIDSIAKALKEYDGCEFDVRLSGDSKLVIHHNCRYKGQRVLDLKASKMKGVDLFPDLLASDEILRQVNEWDRTLWVELKEDGGSWLSPDKGYCQKLGKRVLKELQGSALDLGNVRMISFSPHTLPRAKTVKRLPLAPYVYSGTDSTFPSRNHKTILKMFTPLKRHIARVEKKNFDGLLFSKKFFKGFFSIFNPTLEKVLKNTNDDFILGTEAENLAEEEFFSDIVAITDYRGKRKKRKRKAPLICHRGVGEDLVS